MRGDLQTTSLADLCRRLADEGSTGRIELSRPGADARITLRGGEVIMATSPTPGARLGDRLVNAGLLYQDDLDRVLAEQARSNERTKLGALLVEQQLVSRDAIRVFVQEQILDAVFDLMRWETAEFEFVPGSEHTDKLPVSIPVSQLLVEVSRRQNEWHQISQRIPHLDVVPDFVVGGSSASASLEPDEFALMASVDGQRTIRELAADLGYSEFEAARVVYGLLLLGIVDVIDADDRDQAGAELEVDLTLGEPSAPSGDDVGHERDDIDVAAALEEALRASEANRAPGPQPPAGPRPEIRVHVRDDGSYVGRHSGPGAEPEPEPEREPEPEPEPEPQREATPPPSAPAAGDARSGPEPWEMPAEEPAAAAPPPPTAGEDEGEPPDIAALLAEMSQLEERPAATEAPDDEPPDDVVSDDVVSDDVVADESWDDVVAAEPPEATPAPERAAEAPERGEVSEFLRELSRLALNDEERPGRRAQPPGDESEASPAPEEGKPRPEPPRRTREDDDKDDDGKKRRGIFGWGR